MLQNKKKCKSLTQLEQHGSGPIVSMEMALAEASFKGSHIMERVKSLNYFKKSTLWHSFIMANGLQKFLINILFNILLWGLPGRVFHPNLDPG